MKTLILVLMAVGLFAAMPVLAAEHEGMKMEHGMMMDTPEGMKMDTPEGVRLCVLQSETIQDKIERLKTEVAKGGKKYSAEDLKKLQKKLEEANKLLDEMYRQ